mgnify:CR=1 FL=1
MAYRKIPEELLKKLDKFWKESNRNRDTFRAKMESDEVMMKWNTWFAWDIITRRRHRSYRASRFSAKRFNVQGRLNEEQIKKLDGMCRDSKISVQSIIDEFPECKFTPHKLYLWARGREIKIDKAGAQEAAEKAKASSPEQDEKNLIEALENGKQ